MSKVTIVGAGNVGATVAQYTAEKDLADTVLIDVIEEMPQGKSLDLLEAAPLHGHDRKIFGTNSYKDTKDSQIVVITAGIPRRPGMTRDDLLRTNALIVQDCARQALEYSPNAIFLVVSNPLDVMTFLTWKTTGLPASQVLGMAAVLDSARFQTFIAMELQMSVCDVRAMVLGAHGDLMVPLPKYSSVNGVPITELIDKERIEAICQRTRNGGTEIVEHLKFGGAWYAPAASVTQMVEAILKDQNRLLPCAVFADGQYGLNDLYIGLPAVLGTGGVKSIVELQLSSEELSALQVSAASIKQNIKNLEKLVSMA